MTAAHASEAARPVNGQSSQESSKAFVEMSDEELIGWLTTSVLEEDEPARAPAADAQDFWDRVAQVEAAMAALGFEGPVALDRAIGLVGLDSSLRTEAPGSTSVEGAPLVWEAPGNTPGELELLRLHADLVEAASRAVAAWASMQGSALRAATQAKG